MARNVNDVLSIMRLAISRRNTNDPDSDDTTLLRYLNNFVSLTMGADIRLFDNYGTLRFEIDDTVDDGVYTFNSVGADYEFETISQSGFISLSDPPSGSLSWVPLQIYLDPQEFYSYWGVENTDVLTPGMPTDMLFYGNQLVFRTIPDQAYIVNIYGYKKHGDFSDVGNPEIDFDYWLRYLAYGAALDYATDFRYADDIKASIRADFKREKTLMLTRNHNQIKYFRGHPSF
jgi:hypothetical protein